MLKRGSNFIIFTVIIVSFLSFVNAEECVPVHISNRDVDHSLDITLVSDFLDNEGLENQAENLAQVMKQVSPFNEFIDNKINIRYVKLDAVQDLECCTNLPFCSQIKVADLASNCPTDEIIVFSQNGDAPACTVKGVHIPAVGAFGQHVMILEKMEDTNPRLLLHELGHSMAFLGDEYSYREYLDDSSYNEVEDTVENALFFLNFPNCERNPQCENGLCSCPKWENVPGAGCFQGCGFDNWYRDNQSSIMNNELEEVSPVGLLQFRSAINRYADYVKEPISIEINRKTEEFIINKFIEKNSDWKKGKIPSVSFSEEVPELNEPTKSDEVNSFIENLVKFALSGLTMQYYDCKNYRIEGKTNPTIGLKFTDAKVRHLPANILQMDLSLDMKLEGKASLSADGKIIGIDPLKPDVKIVKSCEDLLDIKWETTLNDAHIITDLQFYQGELGVIAVSPKVKDIKILKEEEIEFKIDDSAFSLGIILARVLDILDENHFTRSYEFASTLDENIYSLKDEMNENLDDFGLSFKASLDLLGLEQLANMGKPHGMILDIAMKDSSKNGKLLTRGIEIQPTEETLRLSGIASFNRPLASNKAECVQNSINNFNAIDYSSFNRDIPTDPTKFASVKISQTYPNWFIATLWNDGFFCSEKSIPIGDNPEFIPNIDSLVLNKINYNIIPLNPPYIDYTLNEDLNRDGIIDMNNDLTADGKMNVNLVFDYTIGDNDYSKSIDINLDYKIPLVLEEPDMTVPQDEGHSSAQSYFRTNIENSIIKINNIICQEGEVICDNLKLKSYQDVFAQEMKENIVSHIDRAIKEIELNPIRDVNLNFGKVGTDYFDVGFNLNYGEYVSEIEARNIEDQWAIYDFDLKEKCKQEEDCGAPGKAKINSIKEIFYKEAPECANIPYGLAEGNGCKCIKGPTEESKACIDSLQRSNGELYHYIKIKYSASRPQDLVSYNLNLINWNYYKKEPGRTYTIYLTDSLNTYNDLQRSKQEKNSNIEFIDAEDNIHYLTSDATQVIAFRSKTEKGVEQNFKCMASIIIDRSPDMFNYIIKGALITVHPRLRLDVNDDYTVCAGDEGILENEGYF
ncbi:MAG: M64 family metallopeptidase [Nanoarchaeota archaeon]|nr:M64 family metallopeptidase [Nanoarchaeota archaeon]